MTESINRTRIETEGLIVGYVMSRLDQEYLMSRGLRSWTDAFAEAAVATGLPPASIKNLRDEFDPFHENSRRGWHKRDLRPNRQRVLSELQPVSNEALLVLVGRILVGDKQATFEAIDSLAVVTGIAHNVAERLLTGRKAEEYFIENSLTIAGVKSENLIDLRNSALGFDFGVGTNRDLAIEVKGIKHQRGAILFTDREWAEARFRGECYLLVVVGNLVAEPRPRLIRDPHAALTASCQYRRSVTAVWTSQVSVTL